MAVHHPSEAYLKRVYGISVDDWMAMYRRQGGVCAICRRPKRNLSVDHNHQTGRVRGLLCYRCNVNLGFWEWFYDKAIKYLEGK